VGRRAGGGQPGAAREPRPGPRRARGLVHVLEHTHGRGRAARTGHRTGVGVAGVGPYGPSVIGSGSYSDGVIYCVIPRELEDELDDKMVEYYKDNPNVGVIGDRREGPDRRTGNEDPPVNARRPTRDRRRPRVPGPGPRTD